MFESERQAQLVEDICDAVDRYLASEDASLSGAGLLDDLETAQAEQAAELAEIREQVAKNF